MRTIVRHIIVNLVGLYLMSQVASGLSWGNDIKVLLMATVVLGLINITVRPIVRLITLPINILTLGFFGVVINAGVLYAVTRLVPGFSVSAFTFSGFSYSGFIIPGWSFGQITAFLIVALGLSVVTSFVNWLINAK